MVRFKNRWFLIEFIHVPQPGGSANKQPPAPPALESTQVYHALKQSILRTFGEAGWGAVDVSLSVKYCSPTTRMAIVRVARDHHRTVWAALTLLTHVGEQRCVPHVVHLSGTIKQAQVAAIKHDREVIARFRARAAQASVSGTAPADHYDASLEQSARELEALED